MTDRQSLLYKLATCYTVIVRVIVMIAVEATRLMLMIFIFSIVLAVHVVMWC